MKWIQPLRSSFPVFVEPKFVTPPEPAKPQSHICLKIGPDKQQIQFELDESVCIGRLDAGQDIFPDIDLTQFNMEAKAVSRRHVRLFLHNSAVMIEDLDSLNGTYLNGKRLPPFLSVPLSDGDCLKLSSLQVEVALL